jgi:ASC-1-like (ASCH) protein
MKKRLFVPLSTEPFNEFANGSKTYELRVYGRQWTEKHVWSGRDVELRRGYSVGQSIHGTIGDVAVGPLRTLFSSIGFEQIAPSASTLEEAIDDAKKYSKNHTDDLLYIAFEVRHSQ